MNLERTVVSTLKCVCSLYPPWACSSLSFSTESVEPCSVLRLWPHPEHSGDSTRLVATLSRLVHVAVHRFILCHADRTRGAQMKPRSWVCLCACVELSLAQGWQDSVKQPALPHVAGHHPIHGAPRRTRGRGKRNLPLFLPAHLLVLPSAWDSHLLPWFSIFRLGLNYIISVPGCPACRGQVMGHLSLRNWRSQFLKINLSPVCLLMYLLCQFCLSGEP